MKLSFHKSPRRASRGFTLIELLIYMAITAVVVGMFASVLITVARIQGRQSGASKVTTEMGFLMTTMRRLVHESFDFSVPDAHTLILSASPTDPNITKILTLNVASTSILLTDNSSGDPVTSTLSTANIRIDDLVFTDRSIGASKSVTISVTGTVFPDNPQQMLTRTLETTAALYVQEQ